MIVVIDYGLGNLRSVAKALEKAGAEVTVSSEPGLISSASALVLPGVGAFARGRTNLYSRGLIEPIREVISGGRPFLGICLGLQLLFSSSSEYGSTPGLDIIKGKVLPFRVREKIPHMGWNTVDPVNKNSFLFENIPEQSYFYFVHSYYVTPEKDSDYLASTEYGISFCSAAQKDNVCGVQFHPEKSGPAGLRILENFVTRSKNAG